MRDDKTIKVYLNGLPEIEVEDAAIASGPTGNFFFGGRSDDRFGLEGRMCNVAVYDKVISMDDIHNELITTP